MTREENRGKEKKTSRRLKRWAPTTQWIVPDALLVCPMTCAHGLIMQLRVGCRQYGTLTTNLAIWRWAKGNHGRSWTLTLVSTTPKWEKHRQRLSCHAVGTGTAQGEAEQRNALGDCRRPPSCICAFRNAYPLSVLRLSFLCIRPGVSVLL